MSAGERGKEPARGGADALVDAAEYPLYVVTAGVGDELSGCLAGFVTQSSIKPVRFLVCVSKVNHTFRIAERCKGLALHLLGSDQIDLAALFGETTGDTLAKFEHVNWSKGVTGAPLLNDCAAWVEGPILNRMSAGDHEAFLISGEGGASGRHQGRLMLSDADGLEPGHPA
ncbi:MAG TPA: flavin reductase family protein [Acidimicrobiales bacterium]